MKEKVANWLYRLYLITDREMFLDWSMRILSQIYGGVEK